MYNFYREDWLPQKMAGMLEDSFGGPPIVRLYGGAAATLAAGPAGRGASTAAPPPGERRRRRSTSPALPQPATDDWPFLYLRERFIAPYYLAALAIIIAFAVLLVGRAAQRSGTSLRQFSPHFFVLGIAFLLLETKSLATFSLLFGTTWIVNALVFFAVLASVLLAIVVNQRVRFRNPALLYAGLFGSIALAFLAPAGVAAHRADLAPLRPRGGARVRPDLLRQPGLHLLVPRHEGRRHGVRVEPAGRRRRWRDRVRRARHRLRLAAGLVGGLYAAAWLLATRVPPAGRLGLLVDRATLAPGAAG